jgi:hypothetical protein
MKKYKITNHFWRYAIASFCVLAVSCKNVDYFKTEQIERQVSEYNYEGIDQSSPIKYYISRAHVLSEGKWGQLAKMSTAKFEMDTSVADKPVNEKARQRFLNEKIVKMIIYKDSVAVIVTEGSSGRLMLNQTWIENGKWVNAGQDMAGNMEDANKIMKERLPKLCSNIPRIEKVRSLPTDIKSFTDYLMKQTLSPEDFILQQIATHTLVINGEYHRRKVSWDMLRRLVSLPNFPKECGTIFMELPSWKQTTMDKFLSADTLNGELILDIFRDEQVNGWWDKGEYEFICDVWRLNQRLPIGERIKIRLADYQIPLSKIHTAEEYRIEDSIAVERNTHMADVIEQYIKTKSDPRNSLFLVGCAHACKSGLETIVTADGDIKEIKVAGGQLAERFGAENVFTVFQHAIPRDNMGGHRSSIRGGIFDQAFADIGNRPLGFALKGSPFGIEPFDGIYEMKYEAKTGNYQDNFDGYLFLHPLADEPNNDPLWEVFSYQFIAEMQRRSAYLGWDKYDNVWFGCKISELTKEKIRQALSE